MKLSEAIRLGSMLKPQARNGYRDGDGSCALSAAADACGVGCIKTMDIETGAIRDAIHYGELRERFPMLDLQVPMPITTWAHEVGESMAMLRIVYTLNDSARWSREQIADWVESIERADEAKTQSVTEAIAISRLRGREGNERWAMSLH